MANDLVLLQWKDADGPEGRMSFLGIFNSLEEAKKIFDEENPHFSTEDTFDRVLAKEACDYGFSNPEHFKGLYVTTIEPGYIY